MSSFLVGWWDSVLVRQWDSEGGCRLSAFRRKELRGAVRIGLCRAKAPPKGSFTNDSQ
jgi:hypothetical protein